MKLLVIGDKARTEKYLPDLPVVEEVERVVADRGTSDAGIIALAPDADFILADAISPVSAELIEALPKLKLIHSEGVAFNAIDCAAAKARGIYVCNNQGVNAVAVAEQTILLMLGLLKSVCAGDLAVREGRQIQMKEGLMVKGIGELAGAKVGLIGFGAIAQEVAKRLAAFDAQVFYTKRHPDDAAAEAACSARYLPQDELLGICDFVSMHVPVTPATSAMVDQGFLAKMKEGSYLINTARGEVVDNAALREALVSGHLAGAGFDTLAPEPVQADNLLVDLPEAVRGHVLYSPHIGGVTSNMFYRAHKNVWENIARVIAGDEPINIVNR